jgi:hypothetical protein
VSRIASHPSAPLPVPPFPTTALLEGPVQILVKSAHFKGTVKPLTIGVDVLLEVGTGLNSSALQTWNGQGFFLEDPATKKHSALTDIEARFTGKSAEIWLYARHSGVDGALDQDIATTFQVTVIGFTDAIAYCPKFTEAPPSIDRQRIAIKDCTSPVTDFRSLSSGVVKKTP